MSTSVELPDPADLMKRLPKRFIKLLALLFLPIILIYVAYFFYLNRHSLAGSTPESEAFWAVGSALLESQVGKQKKYAMADVRLRDDVADQVGANKPGAASHE